MMADRIYTTLQKHIPEKALAYCFNLWEQTPFDLKITKTRQTKVGDFTCKRNSKHFRITLNHDLNPYLFLLTYIHEVAHLRVYMHYADKVEPHGKEWKHVFQLLMSPVLMDDIFPAPVFPILKQHMSNPKASSFADSELTLAFRTYDKGANNLILVSSLPEGTVFKLQGRFFRKGVLRRTRIVCKELKSKRQYLVPVDALVSDVQLSLL